MGLDPHWVSTLFGAYYFMGSFYLALAAVTIISCVAVKVLDLGSLIRPKQFHDLGKLMFGFCVVTGDFFYAQFLVIWYGNLPEETKFIVHRLHHAPWEPIAWAVLIIVFVIPFLVFLIRKIKMRIIPMLIISSVIFVGMWIERFLLVAPSIWKGHNLPIGIMEVLITMGFLGVMALCLLVFLRKFPILPISDPLLYESLQDEHH
jgi:Ni/Fe-hydrogenase subunit HybB-like protein